MLLKDQFERRTNELSGKIEAETKTLTDKLEEARRSLLERVEALFDRKFIRVVGVVIGAIPVMYAGVTYLEGSRLGGNTVALVAALVGITILAVTYLLSRRA